MKNPTRYHAYDAVKCLPITHDKKNCHQSIRNRKKKERNERTSQKRAETDPRSSFCEGS